MDASFSMHCCVDSLNCSNVICLFLDLLSSCLTHYIGLDHTSLPITLTVIFSYINGLHDCREYREHVKDLSCVSKDFCRIVIVDNNPFSFILQPLNGIPCVPFSAGQHSDDQVTGDEHRSFSGSELQLSKIILIFPCLNISAHDGYISTSEASFTPERCPTCIARKVSYARMVPKAWDPPN
jgi:hypothetical protein